MFSTPTLYSYTMCLIFWNTVWQPFVLARRLLTFADSLPPRHLPNWPVLRVLGPLCIQRVIADAVTARIAWLYKYHLVADARFGVFTPDKWEEITAARFPRKKLRSWHAEGIRLLVAVSIDGLAQLVILSPDNSPPAEKLLVVVCLCSRLAQFYAELCRRFGYKAARAMLAEDIVTALGPQAGTLQAV